MAGPQCMPGQYMWVAGRGMRCDAQGYWRSINGGGNEIDSPNSGQHRAGGARTRRTETAKRVKRTPSNRTKASSRKITTAPGRKTTRDPPPIVDVEGVGRFDDYIVLTRRVDVGKLAHVGLVYWAYPYDGSSLPRLAYYVTANDRDQAAAKLPPTVDYMSVALPTPRLILRPLKRERLTKRALNRM